MPAAEVVYKRARFGTRIPADRVYTPSHYWLLETEPGVLRIGFTKFATRMLGDIVEYSFDAAAGTAVGRGQRVGWIEGFKAVSDIYSPVEGVFATANPALRADITLVETAPYGDGWLYEVAGRLNGDAVDANGYAAILDATIDKMLASRHDGGRDE